MAFDAKRLCAFLEEHFGALAQQYLPGGAAFGRLSDFGLKQVNSIGTEAAKLQLRAYFLEQCCELVHKGVTAGLLSHSEGWRWLLRAGREAQPHFDGFQQFWAAARLARLILHGPEAANAAWLEAEAALQCEHPRGAGRLLPWDEDLSAIVPWIPTGVVTLRYSALIECPRCAHTGPLVGLAVYSCTTCGHQTPIEGPQLTAGLARPARCFMTGTRRPQSTCAHGTPGVVTHMTFGEPLCAWCDAPLPAISADLFDEHAIICGACGGTHRSAAPPAALLEALPMAHRLLTAEQAPAREAPTCAVTCAACAASTNHRSLERAPSCSACGVRGVLPDDAWYQLVPRPKATLIQVLVEERATQRERYGTGALLSGESDYATALSSAAIPELRPYASARPAPRPDAHRHWLLALGALDIVALGGEVMALRPFPSFPHYLNDSYVKLKRRYPELSREWVQQTLLGELPQTVARSAVAALRHVQVVGRFGLLFGWADEAQVVQVLEQRAALLAVECASWDDFANALARRPVRGEHPRALRERLDLVQAAFWSRVAWHATAKGSAQPPARGAADAHWEAIRVRGTTNCPRCAWDQPLLQLAERQMACTGCGARWLLEEEPATRLEPHLFEFRRNAQLTSRFVTDHVNDGVQHWLLARTVAACLRCRQPMTWTSLDLAEKACRACRLVHAPLVGDALPQLSPSLVGILATKPPAAVSHLAKCANCGGDLETDGEKRLVRCRYCVALNVLPDQLFLKMRGSARQRDLTLLFDSRLPATAPDASRRLELTVHGTPILRATTGGAA
ncbi:MAG TPA: DUF1266 domain-containing protein [Polyangiaceae bacterium]|nr:DUF1266 domain-containing protein [Polyangiaceae bacterium]